MKSNSNIIFIMFFISLTVFTFSNSLKTSQNLNSIISSKGLLGQSTQGKLTQILIQVQTSNDKNSIKDLVPQVKSIVNTCQTQQLEHQKLHAKMSNQCQTEKIFREKEVSEAGKIQRSALEARAKCDANLKLSQKEKPELTTTLNTYNEELKSSETFRLEENKKYKLRKQEYEEAISFINQSVAALENTNKNTKGNTSLVDISERLLKHSSKLGLLTESIPVLVALASSSKEETFKSSIENELLDDKSKNQVNLDANLKTKLKDTFAKLIARLQKDWNDNEEMEKKSTTANTEYTSKLKVLIDSLNLSIKISDKQIEAMTKCKLENDAIANQSGIKNSMNSKILDNANSMCSRFDKEFLDATKGRFEQITTCIQISGIVNKRFSVDTKELDFLLKTIKESWESFMNSEEFKKRLIH